MRPTSHRTSRSRRSLAIGASLRVCLSAAARGATDPLPYVVDWTRGCPPVGYLTAAQKAAVTAGTLVNPNPALDLDLSNTMVNTAWDVPITMRKARRRRRGLHDDRRERAEQRKNLPAGHPRPRWPGVRERSLLPALRRGERRSGRGEHHRRVRLHDGPQPLDAGLRRREQQQQAGPVPQEPVALAKW